MELITNYSQPEFYRFSRDSIELANLVVNYLIDNSISPRKVADLCCGSGVISLEIIQKLMDDPSLKVSSIDFYELQEDYRKHLENNIGQVSEYFPKTDFNINICNILKDLEQSQDRYDLIVMNPPYFHHASGRSPKDERTRICREYKDGQLNGLLNRGVELLSANGRFFFVCREDKDSIRVIEELSLKYRVEKVSEASAFSIYLLLRS
ncbi:methyltransferase [Halobacteriovorax sp. HFRX-2_2]|uniref:methyltransferase n=1 Tax=unclassified Halobacteriovorax TaxID=2639665 RepID=UPI003719F4A5